jgi:hypothetical protein
MSRRLSHATAGFSNQQALLALLIAFPIGLIGLGLVLTAVNQRSDRSISQTPAETTTPDVSSGVVVLPENDTTREPELPAIEPNTSRQKPLASEAITRQQRGVNCWFQMETGGRLKGNRCVVTSRLNVNGDKVFDVIEASGLTRSIVLWDNAQAEVFLEGARYTGNWRTDSDGDVRVTVGGGTFAFTPN